MADSKVITDSPRIFHHDNQQFILGTSITASIISFFKTINPLINKPIYNQSQ
jgi:hypothetical protein